MFWCSNWLPFTSEFAVCWFALAAGLGQKKVIIRSAVSTYGYLPRARTWCKLFYGSSSRPTLGASERGGRAAGGDNYPGAHGF